MQATHKGTCSFVYIFFCNAYGNNDKKVVN